MEKKKQRTSIKEEEPLNLDDSIIQRFFKVMTPDFLNTLRLPPAFCKDLKAGILPDTAVLSSRKGRWIVKIGGGTQVCFNEGWDKFAVAHQLELGDFAVFEHQGNMHFKVYVYDSTSCENHFEESESESESESEEKTPGFGQDIYDHASRNIKRGRPRKASMTSQQNHQFTAKIHTKNHIRIPKSFCKWNKLEGVTHILLNGPCRKLWKVNLRWNNINQCFRTSDGWVEFCNTNGLKDGDICIFKLSSDPSTSASPIQLDVQLIQAP